MRSRFSPLPASSMRFVVGVHRFRATTILRAVLWPKEPEAFWAEMGRSGQAEGLPFEAEMARSRQAETRRLTSSLERTEDRRSVQCR